MQHCRKRTFYFVVSCCAFYYLITLHQLAKSICYNLRHKSLRANTKNYMSRLIKCVWCNFIVLLHVHNIRVINLNSASFQSSTYQLITILISRSNLRLHKLNPLNIKHQKWWIKSPEQRVH